MGFCFGLRQVSSSKTSTSWITLIFLHSMLCMWTSVECWSYFYSNTTMDWQSSRDWCQKYYTDMVAIQNQEEISYLNSWLPKKDKYYWIGIRKVKNVWTWVGTNKALTAEATNWAEREPNNGNDGNSGGNNAEDCVEMYIKRDQQPGKWNDEKCTNEKTALCYTDACKSDSCVHGGCVETIESHKCVCFEGFYGDKCEHVVQCEKDMVTLPEKASVSCSHEYGEYSYDSVCQYSCEEGYQLSTPRPMRCNASGNWSEQPPTCELVQCKDLSRPERGFMECSNPLGSFSYQSNCVFSCEEGYVLVGSQSNSRKCEASGLWNESQPFCVGVQCPVLQQLENGVVSCGEDEDMRFSYGNTCNFSCAPGYQLVGSSTVTCMSTAEWSEEMPRCEAITCQKPEGDAQLLTQCSHHFNELRPDSTCSFSCDTGFELQGAPSIQCSEHGEWTSDIPTCKALQCPPAMAPVDGQIMCVAPSLSSPVSTEAPSPRGTVCTFSCDDGHELQGVISMECTPSGQWTSTPPTCTGVQCPVLQQLENGVVSCGEDEDMRFSYGNTCNFSCAPGYQLVGSSTVTCMSTADWSEEMPRCEAITCQKPEGDAHLLTQCSHPFNELRPDSTCSFSCDTGFELQGAPSIQCSEHGEWTSDIPTCKALQCPPAVAPVGGQIICVAPLLSPSVSTEAPSPRGTVCTFSCDDGHELQGVISMECTSSGQWTSTPPTCTAVRCPLLEAPVNGSVNCSDAELIYNSHCSFTCDQEHSLHGHKVVICGHHGNWTGETPICEASVAPRSSPTTIGLATGGAVSLSGLSLAAWLLKRLRRKGNKFELNSSSELEDYPQFYKNSVDSLI